MLRLKKDIRRINPETVKCKMLNSFLDADDFDEGDEIQNQLVVNR